MTVIHKSACVFQQHLECKFPKNYVESLQYRSTGVENFMSTRFLATFTVEMIRNEADPVLK